MSRSATTIDLDALAAFAHRLANASGQAILPYFRAAQTVVVDKNASTTAAFDPVTAADRDGEAAIRALIRATYPEHGVLGEEHGYEAGCSPLHWVIDPIDGTRAFISGQPQWGTLIALNDGERPVLGVLDQPWTGERWIAWNGRAELHLRGASRPLRTRQGVALRDAVVCSTHPWSYFTPAEQQAFRAIDRSVRMTRFGGDCYAYGLVAMGFVDAVVESALKPWDIQALIPIIECAGGVVTDWRGGPAAGGGRVVAAGDPALHGALLQVLGQAGA